jgi:hypothetical protein
MHSGGHEHRVHRLEQAVDPPNLVLQGCGDGFDFGIRIQIFEFTRPLSRPVVAVFELASVAFFGA